MCSYVHISRQYQTTINPIKLTYKNKYKRSNNEVCRGLNRFSTRKSRGLAGKITIDWIIYIYIKKELQSWRCIENSKWFPERTHSMFVEKNSLLWIWSIGLSLYIPYLRNLSLLCSLLRIVWLKEENKNGVFQLHWDDQDKEDSDWTCSGTDPLAYLDL